MAQALTKTLRDRVRATLGRLRANAERDRTRHSAAGNEALDVLLGNVRGKARGPLTWGRVEDLTISARRRHRCDVRVWVYGDAQRRVLDAIDRVLRDSDLWASGWVAQSMRVGYVRIHRSRVTVYGKRGALPGQVRYTSIAWLKGWPKRRHVHSGRCLSRAQAMDEGLRNLGRLAKAADKAAAK